MVPKKLLGLGCGPCYLWLSFHVTSKLFSYRYVVLHQIPNHTVTRVVEVPQTASEGHVQGSLMIQLKSGSSRGISIEVHFADNFTNSGCKIVTFCLLNS